MLNLFKWIYRKGEERAVLHIIALIQNHAQRDDTDSQVQVELYKIANALRATYFKGDR